jgi:tetratricopeptide (TPR) repeat protein
MEIEEKTEPGERSVRKERCSCSLTGTRFCEICPENPNKRALQIKSARSSELTTDIVLDGLKYHVQTERLGPKNPVIITNVWKAGEIVSTKKIDYRHLLDCPGMDGKLEELMHQEHRFSMQEMTMMKPPGKVKDSTVYLEEVRCLVKSRNYREALKILEGALIEHPFNPFLLSYQGWMVAVVSGDYNRGTEICKDAFELFKADEPVGFEFFSPFFYLNLGRAYRAAGDKRNAVQACMKGLDADPEDSDLLAEISELGRRRKPMIPFLKRSNPVNKFAGILLHNLAVA